MIYTLMHYILSTIEAVRDGLEMREKFYKEHKNMRYY